VAVFSGLTSCMFRTDLARCPCEINAEQYPALCVCVSLFPVHTSVWWRVYINVSVCVCVSVSVDVRRPNLSSSYLKLQARHWPLFPLSSGAQIWQLENSGRDQGDLAEDDKSHEQAVTSGTSDTHTHPSERTNHTHVHTSKLTQSKHQSTRSSLRRPLLVISKKYRRFGRGAKAVCYSIRLLTEKPERKNSNKSVMPKPLLHKALHVLNGS